MSDHLFNSLKLGCIADDFTGATDLANNLVRSGMRVLQTIGTPSGPLSEEVDAVVVALKSRSISSDQAVAKSLEALRWLEASGAQQIYFKVCSTFDSTAQGNIGPVAEALMDAMDDDFAVVCPAFPTNRRTVYMGYLFADGVLLNEGSMRHHPVTPMTDANLVRVLQSQTKGRVGLVPYDVVQQGSTAIQANIEQLQGQGFGLAIADAITDDHLLAIGRACHKLKLVVGGSGVAIGLPPNWQISPRQTPPALPQATGSSAIIAGSCSEATRLQIKTFDATYPGRSWRVDPLEKMSVAQAIERAMSWAAPQLSKQPVLIYASASPDEVAAAKQKLGEHESQAWIEGVLSSITRALVVQGVRQVIVAGGETAGACVQALHIEAMRIGQQIDPGVPWCYAKAGDIGALHLALKSGNFGAPDLFVRAFELLPKGHHSE
jgi:uncharacterized protein YgbK (DUF1537 family)